MEGAGWQSQVMGKAGNVMPVLIKRVKKREPPAAQDLKPQAVALPARNRPTKLFGFDDENAKLGADHVIDLSGLAGAGVDWHHQVVEVVIRGGEFSESIADQPLAQYAFLIWLCLHCLSFLLGFWFFPASKNLFGTFLLWFGGGLEGCLKQPSAVEGGLAAEAAASI